MPIVSEVGEVAVAGRALLVEVHASWFAGVVQSGIAEAEDGVHEAPGEDDAHDSHADEQPFVQAGGGARAH
jgi:hypothetical protein